MRRRRRSGFLIPTTLAVAVVLAVLMPAAARADVDPRVALTPGWLDAGSASSGMELLAHNDRPPGFFLPTNIGSLSFANSDIAFSGNYAFAGSFNGFNIYNLGEPAHPTLQTSVVCPGGQGDMSVYGNLLFMSVERRAPRPTAPRRLPRPRRRASAASGSSTSAISTPRRRLRRCRRAAARTPTRS